MPPGEGAYDGTRSEDNDEHHSNKLPIHENYLRGHVLYD